MFVLALGAVACGDDDRTGGNPDTGSMTLDGGPADTGRRDAPRPDRFVPMGDGNDSFAEAETLEFGPMMPGTGALNPAMDSDFYTFEGMAGQWVWISTTANPDDDPTMVDTVITLYDSTMNQIAENDDGVPRINVDSEIITRLPDTGTYYIEVQEFSAWLPDDGIDPEGDPTYTYELDIIEISDMAAAVTVDTETGDDVASALPITQSMDFGLVLGTFDDATDIDVFTVTIAGTTARNLTAHVMPTGINGYGSTSAARIWITNEAGTEIIARIDQADDYSEISPSVMPGMYRVFVEHSPAAVAENDFYVLKVFTGM